MASAGEVDRLQATDADDAPAHAAFTVADPNDRPPASGARVMAELQSQQAARKERLVELTDRIDALEQAIADFETRWRDRIVGWTTSFSDAAAQANAHPTTALPSVSAAKDRVAAAADVFGSEAQ